MTRLVNCALTSLSETGMTNCYILKRPNTVAKRRSWSLLLVQTNPVTGKRESTATNSPLLDQINDSYQKGVLTLEQGDLQAVDLRTRLNRELRGKPGGVVFNQHNLAILGDLINPALGSYWYEVYGRRKRLVDRRSSYYDLRRAIEAVGNLSLLTATEREIQAAVDGHGFEDNKQRRVVSRLMPILKFIGRKDVELEKARPEQKEVRHLTMGEFGAVLAHIEPGPFKTLCKAAFNSGCRLGELFALTPSDISPNNSLVYVNKQMTVDGRIRLPKTRSKRKVALIAGGPVREWIKLDASNKLPLRGSDLADRLKIACIKAFPTQPEKHCRFHDLRHSYAVYLIHKNVSLPKVAQSLGNSFAVCEQFYSGKVLTSESVDEIREKLGHRKGGVV